MILLRPILALFSAASSNTNDIPKARPMRLSSSDVADAAPFEPIRDTCLEDFRREQEDEKEKLGKASQDPTGSSSFLSSFSTLRNGPHSQQRGSAERQQQQPQQHDQVVYRVCLSPGCVADGAVKTYEQLLALAPPHVIVEPGTCHSLCGNGPVVDSTTSSSPTTSSSNNNKRVRKVSGPKVLQLLQDEGVIPELADGYDLVMKGDEAFAAQQYSTAIEKYEKAVQTAFRPAMEAQAEREHLARLATINGKGSSTAATRSAPSAARSGGGGSASLVAQTPTSSLDWLVRARRNTAKSLLRLGDLEAALLEAQAACNLSRNTCWRCFAVVADCYRHKGGSNAQSEYETLKALFALPVNEEALDFPSKNERRELQFRMQRLAKDLQQ
jgi:tetratricopeptide (TPR) repeat protein